MTIDHQEADRVPIVDNIWQATADRWRKEGLPSGIEPVDYFGFEMVGYGSDTTPQFKEEVIAIDDEYITERDSYGGTIKNHRDYTTTPLIIDYPCKSRDEWDKLKPRLVPSDRRVNWVSDLRGNQRERSLGKYITFNAIVGYDKLQKYVASERLLRAVLREPEWIKDMYRVDTDLVTAMCDRMIDGGFHFDGAFLFCDLGYRHGPFFSPRHYEDQLHPIFKELCDFFHDRDMQVILHCCGNVKELIPYFIDAGIDCLQPLEVKAGMDVIELKEEFGDQISFMGGIDVRLMNLDDPAPIEKEIREKVSAAKVGGGYIYHSDHSIPNTVSFKNYQRVIELVRRYGKYRQ